MTQEQTPAATPAPETSLEPSTPREPRSLVLKGTAVAPGLVLGPVHRKDYDLNRAGTERVPLDEVERELNRFRSSLDASRLQILDLRSKLEGRVREEDARILDTHVTYLKDSVFIADVENLILNEQMRLEAAIAKVVGDFDRIFRLVQNDTLRQSAVDLRDVGIRVLRNLQQSEDGAEGIQKEEALPDEYVLVSKELSIVDMFDLSNRHVKGIATLEGGITSHAAIFARSMRIPTITGVEDLLDEVHEGDFVILDASEGTLRVNPDDVLRAQYAESKAEEESGLSTELPEWAAGPRATRDGVAVTVRGSCGNLPEVEQALAFGLESIGLYRTELLFLVEKRQPSREALIHHYKSVIHEARGGEVTFRLLNVDSSLELDYLYAEREANPVLGRVGIRALFAHEGVLRQQLQAILLASAEAKARIAIPFVTDCGDLRRVKEILFEERLELRKEGLAHSESNPVGVVIETPAALLGIRDLAREADFLMLNLDSLLQYLLAADRDNPHMGEAFRSLHPFALRGIEKAAQVAVDAGRELSVFGVSASTPENLAALIGVGIRRFCVSPAVLKEFLVSLEDLESPVAEQAAQKLRNASCPAETQGLLEGFRHGYAGESGSS